MGNPYFLYGKKLGLLFLKLYIGLLKSRWLFKTKGLYKYVIEI